MKKFTVNITLKIVDVNVDTSKVLVLVTENGEFPTFTLNHEEKIEKQIFDNLCCFFHEEESLSMFSTKQLSEVYNEEDALYICYNFICPSSRCKHGKFINFNKTSMELNKFTNHRTNP